MIEKLQKIIQHYTCNEEIVIKNDTLLQNDLGINSFELVRIASTLEQEFDITITDRTLIGFKTVQDILDCLDNLGVKA